MAVTGNAARAVTGYSGLQIALHWIVAALVIFQVVAGDSMGALWRSVERGEAVSATDQTLGSIHIWGGIAIFFFALWRLWLRYSRGAPDLPQDELPALKFIANATHVLLYVILIGAPLAGAAAWFGGIEAAAEIHELVKLPLILLVVLHVSGALVQHFVKKTDVLRRMMRPQA